MMVVYDIIEFVTSFVETYICYQFLNLFFKNRWDARRKDVMVLLDSIIITICIFLNNKISLFSNILLLFVIITIGISSLRLFVAGFFQSVTVVGTYYLGITVFDLFSIFLISIVTGDNSIGEYLISSPGLYRSIFICAMKICLVVIYNVIKNKIIDYETLLKYWGFWLSLCLIGYSAIFYFQQFAVRQLTEILASNWLFFLAFMLMVLLIFYLYIKYRDYKEKNAVINSRNEVLEKSYADIQKLYKDNGHVMHDFKNHITVIENYIRKSENEKALEYINNIAKPVRSIGNKVWSGIEVVDIILNCKIAEAEAFNIKIDVNIIAMSCKVSDMDFCTILSNLWDNAIESSSRQLENRRYIKFVMKTINNMLIIKIKNYTDEIPKLIEHSRFETTKKDKKNHGIGLESVEFCVNKYDGNIKYNLGEDYFEVQLLLLSV